MALYDNLGYFDPSIYGGSDGLFGRLMSQLAAQGQYQPGGSFPSNPMDAQASIPPPQTTAPQSAPIAVGDYMMPRVGSGFPVNTAPAPQPSAPSQQPLPDVLQPTQQGGLAGAFQAWANTPLGNPALGVANAVNGYNGRGTQAQQNTAAVFRALEPILGREKALIATLAPDVGKPFIDAAVASGKFQFATLPDGTIVRQDPKTGGVVPVYQTTPKADFGVIGKSDGDEQYGFIDKNARTITPIGGAADNRTTVTGPDGKEIPIPPGADRKTFVKEITRSAADAAAGKMTETQAKASGFAARMEQAEATLKSLDDPGTGLSGAWGKATDSIPLIGGSAATNWAQTDNYQKYKQARSAFITAMLRQESGAAIAKDEFDRYEKEMFPQPGDSADVIKQKAAQRATVIEQMKKAAGPGYKSPEISGPNTTKTGVKWSVE